MKERINKLKEIFANGISREIFLTLILHMTNYYKDQSPAYANYLTLDEWQNLYAKTPNPNINLSQEQLTLFFEYMRTFHHAYVGKSQNIYFVFKNFSNELRASHNFEFEIIVFTTLEE